MAFNSGFFSSSYDLEQKRDSYDIPRISLPKVSSVSSVEKYTKEGSTKDVAERGQWSKGIQSLLLLLSMSVGLGNVWRFPNVAYDNGGGAFLIPYLILLCIIGRPMYYLELIIGQFCSQGSIKMWRVVPAFKGVGYAQFVSLCYVVIFYNYLMALSLFYIFSSMTSCLPWTKCYYPNATYLENGTTSSGISLSEYFFDNEVIQGTGNEELNISWKLALCLTLTWIIVYVTVIQGTASLGKMSYFTALFPFVCLAVLLVITLLQDGAFVGIKFFFTPELEKLKDITVWYKALEQSFFSLSIAYGNIVTIASYNKFDHNVYNDAITISICDTIVNLLAGCVSFAVLGSLSLKLKKNIREVVTSDAYKLAFVVYPEALGSIKFVPQLWSILFFFMLFVLGIGSSMSMIETLLTVFKDRFTFLRQKKWLISLVTCLFFFACGLPLTTNRGQVVLALLNNYGAGLATFFYAVFEVVGVIWIYGLKKFCQDVEFMLNKPPGIFWKVTWAFTAPVALLVIFIYGLVEQESKVDTTKPTWNRAVGWFLAVLALIQIPIWFIWTVYKDPSPTVWKKILNSLKPSEKWGPADPTLHAEWKALRNPDQVGNASVSLESTVPPGHVNETFKEDVF